MAITIMKKIGTKAVINPRPASMKMNDRKNRPKTSPPNCVFVLEPNSFASPYFRVITVIIVKIIAQKMPELVWQATVTVEQKLLINAPKRQSRNPQNPPGIADGGGTPTITLPIIHAHNPTLVRVVACGFVMDGGILPLFVENMLRFVLVSFRSSPEYVPETA